MGGGGGKQGIPPITPARPERWGKKKGKGIPRSVHTSTKYPHAKKKKKRLGPDLRSASAEKRKKRFRGGGRKRRQEKEKRTHLFSGVTYLGKEKGGGEGEGVGGRKGRGDRLLPPTYNFSREV